MRELAEDCSNQIARDAMLRQGSSVHTIKMYFKAVVGRCSVIAMETVKSHDGRYHGSTSTAAKISKAIDAYGGID